MVEENKQDAAANFAFTKELLLFVPLLGSGLAITFDVGYFAGIGLQFFTFFSLTEHIGFAVQALPFALISAALFAVFIPYQSRLLAARRTNPPPRRKRILEVIILVPFLLSLVLFGSVVLAFFTKTYWVLVSVIIAGSVMGYLIAEQKSISAWAITSIAILTLVAFALGHDWGVLQLQPTFSMKEFQRVGYDDRLSKIDTKDAGQIQAILIRSGDRGVLFFDPKTNQFKLERWEQILRVNSPVR
jgi:hypothetical protein